MEGTLPRIINHVKAYRQARGMSQTQLAEATGIKRQAVYDIESGRYLPNTGVAIRMSRVLGCTVETLFNEETEYSTVDVDVTEDRTGSSPRLLAANLRGKTRCLMQTEKFLSNRGLPAADAILEPCGRKARMYCQNELLDRTIFLFGCDPAFSILGGHVERASAGSRIHICFASSYASMEALAKGEAHVGGVHLHNSEEGESNVILARNTLEGSGGNVVGFTTMEEGLMVAPGNPHSIRKIEDLYYKNLRFVNRERGAALRVLLDDCLLKSGLPSSSVNGYTNEVKSHNEGAMQVASGAADAALGLHVTAQLFGLSFVPLTAVRCDLVIPEDLLEHQTVRVMLDVLQSAGLRNDIASIPGYETSFSGSIIDTF